MSAGVLGIAGVGLIGGSLALAARAAGRRTIGFDRDPAALAAAVDGGALDATAPSLAALAVACDELALALPIPATIAALEGEPALAAPALLFDVASVKTAVASAGAHLPAFVPSHPLAGRETAGFGSAQATLFAGRPWAVAPCGTADARQRLRTLILECGAVAIELSPDDHDRLVALSSHAPQVLSVVLGARLGAVGASDRRVFELCGPGMESMLRLARSPAELWGEITAANAAPLAGELRALSDALQQLAAALEAGEREPLLQSFGIAHQAVSAMDRTNSGRRPVI